MPPKRGWKKNKGWIKPARKREILQAIQDGHKTIQEIAEVLGLTTVHVGNLLRELEKECKVKKYVVYYGGNIRRYIWSIREHKPRKKKTEEQTEQKRGKLFGLIGRKT